LIPTGSGQKVAILCSAAEVFDREIGHRLKLRGKIRLQELM
jgi:hypothetical protein